ncbi:MAG: alpha/beta hydrolase-fold protein [Chloroflexota bacterium]
MANSQIIIKEFDSKALAGNPLGDPHLRRVPVYLPYSADQKPARRYPVIYLLTAFAARGLKLLNDSLWEENFPERMDRLIASGEIEPMIVVMPDASTRYGGSQYLDSSATGNYMSHILELVEQIDGKFPTIAAREQRALLGHSSGGYGALRLGISHPDTFGLVAAHAPDLNFDLVYRQDIPKFLRFYDKFGEQGFSELLADPAGMLAKGVSFYALAMAAMASCYSPNPDSPWGFDLPFDSFTGELKQEVWARWLAHDPINLVADHLEALCSLKLLYLDCGLFDEENLLYGARIFTQRLIEHQIPHFFEAFEGGHRNTAFRYDVSLKMISEKLGN